MPCATLCLIMTSQTSNLALDLRISVGTLDFCVSSVELQFQVIYLVGGLKFWCIASPRDVSHLPQILSQSIQPFRRSMDGLVGLTSRL
jgi:hypothetical protein